MAFGDRDRIALTVAQRTHRRDPDLLSSISFVPDFLPEAILGVLKMRVPSSFRHQMGIVNSFSCAGPRLSRISY